VQASLTEILHYTTALLDMSRLLMLLWEVGCDVGVPDATFRRASAARTQVSIMYTALEIAQRLNFLVVNLITTSWSSCFVFPLLITNVSSSVEAEGSSVSLHTGNCSAAVQALLTESISHHRNPWALCTMTLPGCRQIIAYSGLVYSLAFF
jgi:hypothetical protein